MTDAEYRIPVWIVLLVGRLTIEQEAMRRQLADASPPQPPEEE